MDLRALTCALFGILSLSGEPGPRTLPLPEYQSKARMIHALLAFVTWPSQKGSSKTLGILGSSSFGNHMASLERSAHSSSIKTIQSYSLKSLEACDAIFICTSEEERLSGILRSLQGRPVLTLSDTPGFAQRGVMVNMVLWGDRIALEVNLPALRRADLCLSSAVLNHAKLVAR